MATNEGVSPNMTAYGDISPRTAVYASKDFLERAHPHLVLEHFGQCKPIPAKNSTTISFRRYNKLAAVPAGAVLTEGVTPDGSALTKTDVTATLVQYGDWIQLTDVVQDTHEDPVLSESVDILSEQAAEIIETVRWDVIKAVANPVYSNGTARNAVNTKITLATQRSATKKLKRQNAKHITKKVSSTANYATESVAKAFIAICHPDVENDVRDMTGFIDVKDYGSMTPYDNEIGAVEGVRYLTTTIAAPYEDAGGTKGSMESTSGTVADVYPVLYIAKDAFGIVPFKGKNAVTPTIVNPKPSSSDPLGQRGSAGWKAYQSAVILNDAWMVCAEVAATA